jgi:hypothetical protein
MLRNLLLGSVLAIGLVSAASAATMQFAAALDSKSEVPPKTGAGFGDALATLDSKTKVLTYTITFQGLSGPATAAHFHGPAAAGANAGVAVPIGKDPASPVTGNATLTDAQIADLEAGKWYVNIHTAANPGGEIRGQVMPVKAH